MLLILLPLLLSLSLPLFLLLRSRTLSPSDGSKSAHAHYYSWNIVWNQFNFGQSRTARRFTLKLGKATCSYRSVATLCWLVSLSIKMDNRRTIGKHFFPAAIPCILCVFQCETNILKPRAFRAFFEVSAVYT